MITINLIKYSKTPRSICIPFFSQYKAMKTMLANYEKHNLYIYAQLRTLRKNNSSLQNDLWDTEDNEAILKDKVEKLETELKEKVQIESQINVLKEKIEDRDKNISQMQKALIKQSLSCKENFSEIQNAFVTIGSNMKLLDEYMINSSHRAYTTAKAIDSNLNYLQQRFKKIITEIYFPKNAS